MLYCLSEWVAWLQQPSGRGGGGGAFLPLRSYAANIHIFMEKQEPN